MFAFSIVKKIGEGNYLKDDLFIIERVRRERALNLKRRGLNDQEPRDKTHRKDERRRTS